MPPPAALAAVMALLMAAASLALPSPLAPNAFTLKVPAAVVTAPASATPAEPADSPTTASVTSQNFLFTSVSPFAPGTESIANVCNMVRFAQARSAQRGESRMMYLQFWMAEPEFAGARRGPELVGQRQCGGEGGGGARGALHRGGGGGVEREPQAPAPG